VDTCDPESVDADEAGCTHPQAQDGPNQECEDGNACTVNHRCQEGECASDPLDCDDENVCTDDTCVDINGEGICNHAGNTANCDDGLDCTTEDGCTESICTGTPDHAACADLHNCTLDSCVPGAGCEHVANHDLCADDYPCTNDICDLAAGCLHETVDEVCHDEFACTTGECAADQGCVYQLDHQQCDDGDSCTEDLCAAGLGCENTPLSDTGCDDGDGCTLDDTCQDGVCVPGVFDVANCADWDHDGVLGGEDACPYAFDPGNPDANGIAGADACEALSAHGDFLHHRALTLTEGGASPVQRRTHEPVEIPLANGLLDESVAGYWRFDSDASELTGNHEAQVVGAQWTQGAFADESGALAFDGSDYVTTTYAPVHGATDSFTVQAWVKLDAPWQANRMVLGLWTGGVRRLDLGTTGTGHLQFYVRDDGNQTCVTGVPGADVPTGWHHLAGVRDAVDGVIQLYLDGSLVSHQKCTPGSTLNQGEETLYIGAVHNVGAIQRFVGAIDEVVFFNRALTPREVEVLTQSAEPFATGMVPEAQPDFDDVRVTEVGDDGAGFVARLRIIGLRPHSDTPCPTVENDGSWPDREDLCGATALWRFDGDALDVLGLNDGTISGAVGAIGRFGDAQGSLAFDGQDAYVDSSLVFQPGPGDSFTIEFWGLAEDTPVQMSMLGFETPGAGLVHFLRRADDGEYRFSLRDDTGIAVDLSHGISEVETRTWHHFAGVRDAAAGRVDFFVDGIPVASSADPTVGQFNGAGLPLYLGGLRQGVGLGPSPLKGRLDDVVVHDAAKSRDYLFHRANPKVPMVRFLAATAADNQGTEESPSHPFREYGLHWGLATHAVAPFVPTSAPEAESCYGLLNECLGYLGWWRFDEGRGSLAVDGAAGHRTAAISGPAWQGDCPGATCLSYSQAAHKVVAEGILPADLKTVTVEMAANWKGPAPAEGCFMLVDGADPAQDKGFLLSDDGADGLVLGLNGDGETLAGKETGSPGAWHHLAVGFDGEAGRASIWLDGLSLAHAADLPAYLPAEESLILGNTDSQASQCQYFNGAVDEVRLMSRHLTADELLHLPRASWHLGAVE